MTTSVEQATEYRPLVDRHRNDADSYDPASVLNAQPRWIGKIVQSFLFFCALVSIITTVGFVIVLGQEASTLFLYTSWPESRKTLIESVTPEATEFDLPQTGLPLEVGDVLRIGIHDGDEQLEILEFVDEEAVIVRVERGVRGTQPTAHSRNTPLYIADQATITEFFTSTHWAPEIGDFGVLPLLSATLRVAVIAMIVALPLGLATAVYLSEYAPSRVRKFLKPILEILAGVPTVVYGYFALTLVTPLLRAIFGPSVVDIYNVTSAGIVVGILIIPMISSIREDALRAVPNSLRLASQALGATRLETTIKVLLPAALSGITASIILGISRAIGETMIVLIAAGAGPRWTVDNFESAETMAGHIARISTGDIQRGSVGYNSIFAVGLTLFLMTLVLNLISTYITNRFREVYK